MKLRVFALCALGLLQLGADDCGGPTVRENCDERRLCRIVRDLDDDCEIADDMRRVRNELLYAEQPTWDQEVYLFEPDPPSAACGGSYTWTGEVRFCYDESFWQTPPTGEEEPDCEGIAALPLIRFKGPWNSWIFDASCADIDGDPATPELDATQGEISACLRIGDRMEGETGQGKVRVDRGGPHPSGDPMTFSHTKSISFNEELQHPVYAVWLDGVRNSEFGFDVTREMNTLDRQGRGAYISAENSLVVMSLRPDAVNGASLFGGVVVDGVLTNSVFEIDAGDSVANEGMRVPVLMVGTLPGGFYPGRDGPEDGCQYGPFMETTCTDFDALVAVSTPQTNVGDDAIYVYEGDNIDLDVDMNYLTDDHAAIVLTHLVGDGVDDVTIEGSLDFATSYPAVGVGNPVGGPSAFLDLVLHNDFVAVDPCYQVGASPATVVEGPNYACTGP